MITERRVPELIPVLSSQFAGDRSHKPGGRLGHSVVAYNYDVKSDYEITLHIYRVKGRHKVYDDDTIAILWV